MDLNPWMPYLAINMNQVHQLLGLIAIPRHFTLFIPEGQLKDTEKEQRSGWNIR